MLRPLLTHLHAGKWKATQPPGKQRVLYPHASLHGKRVTIDLNAFPRARAYLESHRERLSRRTYVIDAGRQWYEIWVPHNPADWSKLKIAFPDIAEEPRFFLDSSGAVVNGDCYWITLRPGLAAEWLCLILAVANSSFVTRFYDLAFHNKLYAGRRRFMTQYVRKFPLPHPSAAVSRRIVGLVSQLIAQDEIDPSLEAQIDGLVWESFGLVKEAAR